MRDGFFEFDTERPGPIHPNISHSESCDSTYDRWSCTEPLSAHGQWHIAYGASVCAIWAVTDERPVI
jgi:hypothetical protein